MREREHREKIPCRRVTDVGFSQKQCGQRHSGLGSVPIGRRQPVEEAASATFGSGLSSVGSIRIGQQQRSDLGSNSPVGELAYVEVLKNI